MNQTGSEQPVNPSSVKETDASGEYVYWNGHKIDIRRLRQWMVKRVAQEALEELAAKQSGRRAGE